MSIKSRMILQIFKSPKAIIPIILMAISVHAFGQKPEIFSVNRISGPAGSSVVISGSGFSTNSANLDVRFGGASGNILVAKENLIEVRVPVGSTYETVSVTNLGSGLTGYSKRPFLLSYGGEEFDETAMSNPWNFQSDNDLYDLCACDFDNDGKNDVATANRESNIINLFHNTSSLGAISFSKIPLLVNANTVNIGCRDLNGDGKADIVLSRTGNVGDRIYWSKNTSTPGNISFETPQFELVNGNIARRIAIEDLDKDGLPEIIVTNQANNTVSILKNSSSGSNIDFEPFQAFQVIDPDFPDLNTAGLDVGDFNGDGFPEIVILPFLQSNVYILPNRSRIGQLVLGNTKRIRVPGNLVNVAIGDVNFDNKADIVVTKLIDAEVSILLNNFQPGTPPDNDNDIDFFDEVTYSVNTRPWGLDLGDINGDGKVDIAVASIDETQKRVSILENKSTNAGLVFDTKFVNTPELTRNIRLADFNGDSKPDIALTSIESFKITILRNLNCYVPSIFPNEPISVCEGREIELIATPSPGATFEWVRYEGGNVDMAFPPQNEPRFTDTPPSGNYEYRVTATTENGNCSRESDPVSVEVDPGTNPDAPTIVEPASACEGSTITLTVDNAQSTGSYIWGKPDGTTSTGSQLTLSNTQLEDAGRYTLSYTATDGCESAKDTAFVEVIAIPTIEIIAEQEIFCDGNTSELRVTNDPNYSYLWRLDDVAIPGATSFNYEAPSSGDYKVEVITPGNCNVVSEPVTLLAATPPVSSFDAPQSSCIGTEITFTNTTTSEDGVPVYYSWTFGDGTSSQEFLPSHTYSTAGNYTVTLETKYDDESCANSITQQITITAPPVVEINATTEQFCSGETATLSVDDTFSSILWSTNETTPSIEVSTTALYTVTVRTQEGCEASAEKQITAFDLPQLEINPSNPEVTEGESVTLSISGAENYEWSPSTYLDDPFSASPVSTPDTTITYSVTGIDINGCQSSASVTVLVKVEDPTVDPEIVFTPNGDGINDNWLIRDIEEFPGSTVSVFTRNGQKVLEQKDYTQDWDGSFGGRDLDEGVYYYVIVFDGKTIKSGAVTIVR